MLNLFFADYGPVLLIMPTQSFKSVLANERTQIRSDPVPGLSVDTNGQVVDRHESFFRAS